jgi:DNA-binding beta-propeller fold protein YncE
MRRGLGILLAVLALTVPACSGGAGSNSTTTDRGADTTGPPATEEPNDADSTEPVSYAGTTPAPEFPEGLDWLNTDTPLTMGSLQGKVVLLDFWTYGCINCIHIIPDLKRLEAEYPNELVVIGVHSAKFVNESATENIRQVILRYDLEHPVVNDRDFEIWRTWGVNAWPTIVMIDPAGNVVGGDSGEGVYAKVAPIMESLVTEFTASGELDTTPLGFALERDGAPATVLRYPGKVLADPATGRLFVADTGHNRVVVADGGTGEVIAVYGSGRSGYRNGFALEAQFNAPQGMALSEDGATLYVADTGNHVIRSVDVATGIVETLVGTGAIGYPPTGGSAPAVALNSPWGLIVRNGILYIAMAGSHQIWSMDLTTGTIGPLVGNGRESTLNGTLAAAELAQPSGLAFDAAGRLYFADSESSSIRYADVLETAGTTGVVAGSDKNLFEFGDEDGVGTSARLQHPLGVVFREATGTLFVADTYNSKIKEIDLDGNTVTTRYGAQQGWADGTAAQFYEPGGLSLAGDKLYVADTNNHAIRVVDLTTDTTATIVLKGIENFNPPPDAAEYAGEVVQLGPITTGPGPGSFVLDFTLPVGYKVNEDAPSSVQWFVSGDAVTMDAAANRSLTGTSFPVEVAAEFAAGASSVTADVTVIYCREDAESLCLIEQVRFQAALTVVADGPSARIPLPHEIVVPDI